MNWFSVDASRGLLMMEAGLREWDAQLDSNLQMGGFCDIFANGLE
jgi:hypothetical protein